MLKFLIKEATLLTAFVLMGGLLLICYWSSFNLNQGILAEFKHPKVSVVVSDEGQTELRRFLNSNGEVISYEMLNSQDNKKKLSELYPELRNVIDPLEPRFFPISAVIVLRNADVFLKDLSKLKGVVSKQILHEPPRRLVQFLDGLTFVLATLWLLTLSLVLYFNIERIMVEESARWSLMKMLGARPLRLFVPLWAGQLIRVALAAVISIGMAYLASEQIQSVFSWNWLSLPWKIWMGYFVLSGFLASGIALVLFQQRYRKVAFG